MARLKVRRHQQDYAELVLQKGHIYTVGRKDDCDVVLQPDPGISRNHMTVENMDGEWLVKCLSQHININHDGKNLSALTCKKSPTNFYIPPYHFELVFDEAANEKAPEGEDSDSVSEDVADMPMMAPDLGAFNVAIPDRVENPDPIDPEVSSFEGNDEKTNDVYSGGEPYLKFMYSTHSESIRLKGNKWIAGRDSMAQVNLDDKKASRQHFAIEKVGETYFIKDLKSANGTLLNGQELKPHESREVKSGDIITVNQLTVIFELRDLSFSEKLKDLPLQAYSGPMILTSQEWDLSAPSGDIPQTVKLPNAQLGQLPGTVERIEQPKNKMRMTLMAGAAVILLAAVVMNMNDKPQQNAGDEHIKTFDSLRPEDKKVVMDSYTAAQNYLQDGSFQNSLTQVHRIHQIVPFYKDSKELEARIMEALETLRQQEYIAQQRKEQERTRQKVAAIIADCKDRFNNSVDVVAAKACLNEATQLDPENTDGQSLIAELELRLSQAEEAEKRLREYNDSVDKGRELYVKAKNLLQNRDYHEAINAFSAHLNSALPDPDLLKKQSERNIASVERMISVRRQEMMGKARAALQGGNARNAILYAQQARHIDPYDYNIANFIESTKRDLDSRMRELYTDSVIEERFGNLELSRNKWKEIINTDVPDGEYYLKAKRKLQQHGL